MGLLDFFRRKEKKEEAKTVTESQRQMTELEKLCGDDKETYEALLNTMLSSTLANARNSLVQATQF